MIKTLIQTTKARLAAHRRYRQVIAEIESLSQEDLIDIGAFRADLLRGARQEILGRA